MGLVGTLRLSVTVSTGIEFPVLDHQLTSELCRINVSDDWRERDQSGKYLVHKHGGTYLQSQGWGGRDRWILGLIGQLLYPNRKAQMTDRPCVSKPTYGEQ